MNKKIEPDLFARLMKLSSGTRKDILEYVGQTPVSAADLARLTMANGATEPGCAPQIDRSID